MSQKSPTLCSSLFWLLPISDRLSKMSLNEFFEHAALTSEFSYRQNHKSISWVVLRSAWRGQITITVSLRTQTSQSILCWARMVWSNSLSGPQKPSPIPIYATTNDPRRADPNSHSGYPNPESLESPNWEFSVGRGTWGLQHCSNSTKNGTETVPATKHTANLVHSTIHFERSAESHHSRSSGSMCLALLWARIGERPGQNHLSQLRNCVGEWCLSQ